MIFLRKTKLVFYPPPGVPYKEPIMLVKNTRLEIVDTFMLEVLYQKMVLWMLRFFPTFKRQVLHLVNWNVEFSQIEAITSRLN